LPHGKGVLTYPPAPVGEDEEEKPGDRFEGCMVHGKRQGPGKYTWGALGSWFEGEYADNVKQGQGVLVAPDKGRYEGALDLCMTYLSALVYGHDASSEGSRTCQSTGVRLQLSVHIPGCLPC
jgi:hypothetical protein